MQVDADGFALLGGEGMRVALKKGTPCPGGVLLNFEVDDLDAWLGRLAGLGVTLEGEVKSSPEGYRRARLRDADAYEISLFVWTGPCHRF
jgi:hypothetical protein